MKRLFSGIQPSGDIHLGNYIGAIRNWIELQEKYLSIYGEPYRTIFCIVDLHAITIPYEPKKLQERILDTAATLLACGISSEKSVLFVQSHVKEHPELAWLLNTITPLGDLQRMTQFKEKSKQHPKSVNTGLFDYPVLQAADILLYKAEVIPVGEDQVQHLELAREIARKFNKTFGETFPEPKPLIYKGLPAYADRPTQTGLRRQTGAKIMALNDPEKKMSKSIPGSYIALSDSDSEIRSKIMKAVTDVKPQEKMSTGVKNLFTLLEIFSNPKTNDKFEKLYNSENLKYEDLKKQLAEDIIRQIGPIRQKKEEILKDKKYLEKVLKEGAEKASKVAKETILEVKQKMGLI